MFFVKKWLIILLAAVTALLCACAKADTPAPAATSAGSKPLAEVYADIKAQVGFDNVTELNDIRLMERYYGITEDTAAEYAGCINASGVDQEEIVLVKAVDESSAAAVEEKLGNRYQAKLNQNKDYNPEQAALIEKCAVRRDGLYVSMIISEKADRIDEIYRAEAGL